MSVSYEHLLSPLQLTENVTLRNRIISPNVIRGHSQGPETWPADPQFADCLELCSSGASMFSYRHYGKFGGGAQHHGKNDNRAAFDYDNAQTHNYLSQLAETVHMLGSKILVKIEQQFPDGMTLQGGEDESMFPPQDKFQKNLPGMPPRKAKTLEQMKANCCPRELFPQVIDEILSLLKQYKSWGFDGMSMRGDRYIDAATNLREDEYGGPIENRARFTYELLSAVKRELGADFLVEVAMPGSQTHGEMGGIPNGYTLEETIRFAKMMEDVVDVLQIRNENKTHYHPTGYDCREGENQSVGYCKAIKDAGVHMILAANSGFVEPEQMEAALSSGACDLISVGRELIAEPEFTKKLYRGERPTPCIQCNKCHGMFFDQQLPYCSVNPTSGITHRLDYAFGPKLMQPKQKRVAVLGGGLIGMRAAVMAAERGHAVTIYEKTGYLGGKAKYADLYDFKWPIRRYRLWLIDELTRKGVSVKQNCQPTPDELRAAGYDAIIACTGSVEKRPSIAGADLPGIYTSEDIYERRILPAQLGEQIVMVGGSSVATETAMYLAQQGKKITIISRQDMLARDSANPHDGFHETFMQIDPASGYGGMIPAWGIYPDFHEILHAKTIRIAIDRVTCVTDDGETLTVPCDNVIVNGGYAHCTAEAFQYVGCAPEFYLAGDVENTGGDLQKGNLSAFGKVNML